MWCLLWQILWFYGLNQNLIRRLFLVEHALWMERIQYHQILWFVIEQETFFEKNEKPSLPALVSVSSLVHPTTFHTGGTSIETLHTTIHRDIIVVGGEWSVNNGQRAEIITTESIEVLVWCGGERTLEWSEQSERCHFRCLLWNVWVNQLLCFFSLGFNLSLLHASLVSRTLIKWAWDRNRWIVLTLVSSQNSDNMYVHGR